MSPLRSEISEPPRDLMVPRAASTVCFKREKHAKSRALHPPSLWAGPLPAKTIWKPTNDAMSSVFDLTAHRADRQTTIWNTVSVFDIPPPPSLTPLTRARSNTCCRKWDPSEQPLIALHKGTIFQLHLGFAGKGFCITDPEMNWYIVSWLPHIRVFIIL